MLDGFFAPGGILFLFLLIFFFLFIIQLFFYGFFFLKFARYKEASSSAKTEGVSAVICARNEYHQLKENLPLILTQEYPDFEVVVVNHASEDDTAFLLSKMAEKYPQLKIVEIRENLNFFDGKKFPLSIGIKSAANDMVLLTDADCRPVGPHWISLMAGGFSKEKEIVLGYGAYMSSNSILNRLIRFDTIHIALQYFSFALAGIPYMGVGRNMAYRKSLFYEEKGFTSHYNIHSGDDDLFINRAATQKNTRIVADPESFTLSQPKKSFKEWWTQKKRHLSTGQYYRWRHKFLLGLYTFSTVLFYLFFVFLVALNYTIFPVLALFILRLVIQLFIFRKTLTRLNEKGIWLLVPLYEIMLILINTALAVSVFMSKKTKWK
ncbi:MAG: glycosyltransferase [Bacteroidales bacterium]|jgi:glycosyltransferase involved in cell wall biosynthesis